MKQVLVTGATGYIGSRFLRKVLSETQAHAHVLVRPREGRDPRGLAAGWGDPKRITVHGIETKDVASLARLKDEIDHIVHVAAATRFNITEAESLENNVEPTRALVEFAKTCPKLQNFLFASTVYSSGKIQGVIEEIEFNPPEFANFYEKSKFQCEKLLVESGLPWQMQRIATVIADSEKGEVEQFNAVHNTLKLFYFGLISLVPGIVGTPVYLVNGDFVVDSMMAIARKGPKNEFYHVCQPMGRNMKLGEIIDFAYEIFSADAKFKSRRVLKPLYADLDSFHRLAKGLGGFTGILSQAINSIAPFAEQLYVQKDIRVDKARKYAGEVPYPDQKKTFERALKTLMDRQFSTDSRGGGS